MTKFYSTLILLLLTITGLNAQKNYIFSEKAKATFKKIATPESTLSWIILKETEKVPKDEFLQKSKVIFDLDEKAAFKEIRVNKGANGWLHHRLQQTHNGIPIFGAEYLVHEKNGLVETANGEVLTGLNISTTPGISEEVALQMLLNEIGAEKYAWDDEFLESLLREKMQDQKATYFPQGALTIASISADITANDFILGYKFKVKTIDPLTHCDYIVDAFTGKLIYKNSLLCSYDVVGNCQTHRYGTQNITTDFNGIEYRLTEDGRNLATYDASGSDSDNLGVLHYKNLTNNWNDPDHRSACEAHWVVEKTYDYFLNEHDWQGYDGYGSKLTTWINVNSNWNNAQAGGGDIYIGEGDGIEYGPFTAIDIVAHEYTHNVIEFCGANLQNSRESGALNESFADIFGTLVEFYAEPNSIDKDWFLGEDISLIGSDGIARDMSDPSTKEHPATYKDNNWGDVNTCPFDVYCHTHKNAGVQNHWFYILANGKTGSNYFGYDYDVSGIGMNKAAQLALENLKNYISPFSDYKAARNGSIQAAIALNFTTAEINQVKEAWCAVGLGDCSISTSGEITVTSPNGGENLNQGIEKNITWNRTGNTGSEVKIEYSVNAGNEWHTIINRTTNDGVYEWFPPSVETNLALVRVVSLSDETIFDNSNDYFSINACDVKASFDASDQYPCVNSAVIFTSTSTGGANTYKWYINGILSHTGPIFNHIFSQGGKYEIELRSTIGSTCGDIEKFNVFVQPNANADFTYSTASESILFISPDNAIDAIYQWAMGDGESFDTPNVGKSYESAGSYTVCLTVNSSCGGFDSHCENVQANVLGCLDPAACNYNPYANLLDLERCIYGDFGNCNNCLESDSLALVALYNAAGGPNWSNSWNLSQPVNTWYGITTSSCHVTKIDLQFNNLIGEIPNEIGSFQNLEYLDLSNPYYASNSSNKLSGDIPKEIGNLQNLTHLNLEDQNLSGEIIAEIGNLQNLEYLDLSNNNLTGDIPVEIGNLQNLEFLNLTQNNLSANIIPPEIWNLQNLSVLGLGKINLYGEIPSEIGNLRNLWSLYMPANNLSGEIPIELHKLQKLIIVKLFYNKLSGEIPAEIGLLQNLSQLHLNDNNLSGELPAEIGHLQNLSWLWLQDNNLSGCYPSSLCNLDISAFYFDCTGNSGLPDNGSNQGFQDFCNGISPCNSTSTEVYPGDLNFDGVTNYKDILSFGLYHGEYGLERDEAYQDINWSGHPSSDWGATQENTSDIKHTDADGNGVVDLRDVQAIETNYGQTHTASPIITPPNYNSNSPIEVTLQTNGLPSFVGNDDQLILDIKVEDSNGSALALYGGYFSIIYADPDLVINDIEVVFNPSWFGTPNQNMEYIVHHDAVNNKIDIGITKVDHQNSIGNGTIGKVIAAVDNDSPWDTIALGFNVNDIVMQDAEAFALPVGASTTLSSFQITQATCEPSINITSNTSLSNHTAQGLIQTTGNVSITDNQDITFGSDQLKINDGLTIEDGGEFAFYNDPCGTNNRSVGSGESKRIKANQLFKSGNYKIVEDNLVFNFDLIKEGKVSFEILGNSSNSTLQDTNFFEFGKRTKGTQQINILLKELPTDRFYACLKVGVDRYYFEVFL